MMPSRLASRAPPSPLVAHPITWTAWISRVVMRAEARASGSSREGFDAAWAGRRRTAPQSVEKVFHHDHCKLSNSNRLAL